MGLAARELLRVHGSALAKLVVVVPGRRAGRKLLEALALQAGAIEPPRIVTEAGLPQALSRQRWNLASQAAREWAWLEALTRATTAELAAFAPASESIDGLAARLSLARQLAALDREVAAQEGRDGKLGGFTGTVSKARLAALALLSARVGEILERASRVDPARAIARLADPASRRDDVQVVLAGVVEISPALRALLESLSPRPLALIQAGQDHAAGFDELGALVAEYWEAQAIPLRDADWLTVDDPAAAVTASLEWIGGLPPGTQSDQLAIGVLGGELLPGLAHAIEGRGGSLHAAAGEPVAVSAPWLALDALHAWLAREDFSALAAALRHPDIEACLRRGEDPRAAPASLAQLDTWHAEHLPDSLRGKLPGQDPLSLDVSRTRDALRALCAELAVPESRPLSAWTSTIVSLLCRLFPAISSEDAAALRTRSGLEAFADLAQDLQSFDADFGSTAIRGGEALRLWLDWTADHSLGAASTPGAIEALGWLELSMEEAPFLLLVGLNDGWVPQNQRAEPLLGEEDAESRGARSRTRLARDAHALMAIVLQRRGGSGSSGLRALSLRRGAGGDPLRPSRLLFHTDQATAIARGRAFFCDHPDSAAPTFHAEAPAPRSPPVFPMSSPKRIDTVRVTDFKQFLRSPYLYYLQRVLGLERVRDDAWEIDAKGIGDLLHNVLELFARSDERDSQDAKRIEEVVVAGLREHSRNRFGERPLPAVRLQLQQLERRLIVFAQRQAEVARQGWRIHEVELKLQDASLDVDGVTVAITGRVDRIDRHAASGRWRILDYKSGDDGHEPRKAHVNRNGWTDLQLPLYRHFLRERLAGEIELGYFAIPRKLEECGVYIAEFQDQELDAALEEARRLLREMLAGDFARIGRAAPTDRVQRALCGLSLLSLDDEASDEATDGDEECAE